MGICFDFVEGHPTLFTIKLYHGGEFTNFRDRKYIDGKVNYVDMVDIDEFSIHDLDAIMRGLRYGVPPYIYYHFLVPNGDFQFGFRPLGNDSDLINLAQYVADHKLIRVYTEHGECTLLTYYMNPNPVRKVTLAQLDEDDEVVESQSKIAALPVSNEANAIVPISPEYNRNRLWNQEKVMSSCTKRLIMEEFDIGLYQQILEAGSFVHVGTSGTEKVGTSEKEHVEKEQVVIEEIVEDDQVEKEQVVIEEIVEDDQVENEQVVIDEIVEDDQVEDQGVNEEVVVEDQGVNVTEAQLHEFNLEDYMDFSEFENVEVQGGASEGPSDTDDDDSQDSDYWVDEENIIHDVEVDMRDFHMSIDTDVEFMERPVNTNKGTDDDASREELDVIDNDEWDSMEEDSDLDRKRRAVLKDLGKEKVCSEGQVHKVKFHIGQKYKSKKELKDKIQLHALETRRNLFFIKNDKCRLRAICKGVVAGSTSSDVTEGCRKSQRNRKEVGGPTTIGKNKSSNKGKGKDKCVQEKDSSCPWVIQASRSTTEDNWYVKTYVQQHTCLNTRKIRSATATFLSKQIMDQVETNLTVPVKSLQSQLQKKYHVGFSIHKIFRAKSEARKHVVGDYTKQYDVLRDYILELQSTNPDTTVKLDLVSGPNLDNVTSRCFNRIYICLGAMKKGFRAGMRDFLGLDGAFMKGPFPGQILTAVGVDSNNGIYPLAYAIVESENMQSWKWFLDCLGDDLDLYANSNFTFISDRQKGLILALAQMFPNAEHRFCIRHIHENMRRSWKTREYKELLWKCAKATTVPEFNRLMMEFSNFDNEAYLWLKKIPPHHWARSHFTGRGLSDMLLNNLCEVFNSAKQMCGTTNSHSYKVVRWLFKIDPIKGRLMWPVGDSPMKITPPPHHTQPGRPKRKRRQSMEERSERQRQQLHGSSASGSNLSRRFIRIRCGKCKNFGHNARTCKGGVAGSQGGGSQGGGSQGAGSQGGASQGV
ncbi:hypothetical protein LXL04_015133 [Taraxacum kok-saghyz]